jgi:hypothetical protein
LIEVPPKSKAGWYAATRRNVARYRARGTRGTLERWNELPVMTSSVRLANRQRSRCLFAVRSNSARP